MPKTDTLHVRIDPETKERADYIFKAIGITTADAVTIFLRKAIAASGFPFEVTAPVYSAETIAAMREAKRIAHDPNVKGCRSMEEIIAGLESDDE